MLALLCILATLQTQTAQPGQVITLTASASYTDSMGVLRESETARLSMIVVNPAIPQTVYVAGRPSPLLAGVRVRWIEWAYGTYRIYEGICTNDERILYNGMLIDAARLGR